MFFPEEMRTRMNRIFQQSSRREMNKFSIEFSKATTISKSSAPSSKNIAACLAGYPPLRVLMSHAALVQLQYSTAAASTTSASNSEH
jgi:hypothetical protein